MSVITCATFTRPADTTSYSIGDLVANSTTANLVVPITVTLGYGGKGRLERVHIRKSTTTTTNATFRVHFYTSSPTVANGDNAAWSTTLSGWCGSFDVTAAATIAFSNGTSVTGGPTVGTSIPTDVIKTLYALIEAKAAYAPGDSETFTLVVDTAD